MHLAIVSLIEELEPVDWYQQRVETCRDPELGAILAKELKDYLSTDRQLAHD